jgi:hypothetical protein
MHPSTSRLENTVTAQSAGLPQWWTSLVFVYMIIYVVGNVWSLQF